MSAPNVIEVAAGILLAVAIVGALVALYVYRRAAWAVAKFAFYTVMSAAWVWLAVIFWRSNHELVAVYIAASFAFGIYIVARARRAG